MTAKNLSTVTSELITSYGNTAKNVIHAYRAGGERALGFIDHRWERAVQKTGAKLNAEVRGNALFAQRKVSSYYATGIDLASRNADAVVNKVVELADKGVQQFSATAERFSKRTGVTALNTVASAVAPTAVVLGRLIGKLEHRSSLMARRIAGTKAAPRKTARKPAAVRRTVRSRTAA